MTSLVHAISCLCELRLTKEWLSETPVESMTLIHNKIKQYHVILVVVLVIVGIFVVKV